MSAAEIEKIEIPYYRRTEDPNHIILKQQERPELLSEQEKYLAEQQRIYLNNVEQSIDFFSDKYIPAFMTILNENPEWFWKIFEIPEMFTYDLGLFTEGAFPIRVILDSTGTANPFKLRMNAMSTWPPKKGLYIKPKFERQQRLILILKEQRRGPPHYVSCERMATNKFLLNSNIHGKESVWFHLHLRRLLL